jgi:apolipoprotein N-acyltransferase
LVPWLTRRWTGRLLLVTTGALLLFLSFAPYGQFYLAWIGLVPWLLVVATRDSNRAAFGWGWLAGFLFFLANLSYMFMNTVPGALAMIAYLALFFGIGGVVLRGTGLLATTSSAAAPVAQVLGIATVWVALEWLRSVMLTGLPWHFLGHSQTPLLALCQIADVTGVYGVSFWVVCINALVAFAFLLPPDRWRRLLPSAVVTIALIAGVTVYGMLRMRQQDVTYPGPRVLVVQPDHPQAPGGAKSVTQEQSVSFHLDATNRAVRPGEVDLVVWSETTMPPLNQEARDELRRFPSGQFLTQVHAELMSLASRLRTAVVAGGYYVGDWRDVGGKRTGTDIRNSAFLYSAAGRQVARYDKVHLVPFGEVTPFKQSIPWLYRFFLWLGPNSEEYALNAGSPNDLTVFPLAFDDSRSCRFVAPICFDGSDAALVARMFRSGRLAIDVPRDSNDPSPAEKRADFIVSLSNDGWFRLHQRPQHLQAELFRSIENRAPAARCVNTGISGFVDSCGRVTNTLAARTEGTSQQRLMPDRRLTLYTRFGDAFAVACVFATGAYVTASIVWRLLRRRGPR